MTGETSEKNKKAILGTGRPLTIACHMKKTYFFTESTLALLAAEVSAIVLAVSTTAAFTVSAALAVVSAVGSELDELLQAAKAPMERTNKSFFILDFFLLSEWF